jgi:hypothetical protein
MFNTANFLRWQAYRLEPLILKHYSGIKPLRIHRHDVLQKEPYDEMPPLPYADTYDLLKREDLNACGKYAHFHMFTII